MVLGRILVMHFPSVELEVLTSIYLCLTALTKFIIDGLV